MNPVVCVIIPCYNAESWVGEAIQSALDQTYSPIEVIIIDDGSTDQSLEVIKSFGNEVRWETGRNRGAGAARNEGLRLATGEFVKFLDADDVLLGDAVEAQVSQTREISDERTVVYGDVGSMDELGNSRSLRPHRPRADSEDQSLYLLENNILTSCPLHRKELLLRLGGFDARLPRAQEYDLHLRLALSGVSFVYRPHLIYYQRIHSSPHRISNEDHLAADPNSALNRILRRKKTIEDMTGEPATALTRKKLARDLWHFGRRLLQQGRESEAENYFSSARQLSSNGYMGGPVVYRLAVHVLGPVVSERLNLFRKRLVQRRANLLLKR